MHGCGCEEVFLNAELSGGFTVRHMPYKSRQDLNVQGTHTQQIETIYQGYLVILSSGYLNGFWQIGLPWLAWRGALLTLGGCQTTLHMMGDSNGQLDKSLQSYGIIIICSKMQLKLTEKL